MVKRYFNLRKFPNHVFNSLFPGCSFRVQPLFYKTIYPFFALPLFYRISLCQLCFCFQDTRFDNPVTLFTDEELEKMELRYYNAEIHKTAFTLPQFAKKVISISRAVVEQELASENLPNYVGNSGENVTSEVNSRRFEFHRSYSISVDFVKCWQI